jgi:hypothetical protein
MSLEKLINKLLILANDDKSIINFINRKDLLLHYAFTNDISKELKISKAPKNSNLIKSLS